MNPIVVYLVTAGSVIRDDRTKKLSLINIFDLITIAKGLSFTVQSFSVGGKIDHISKGHHVIKISVLDPKGNPIGNATLRGENTEDGGVDINARFSALKLTEEGSYSFRVEVDEKPVEYRTPFTFEVVKR